ncbi:TPA: hypothetical protein ACKOKZ_004328, partial [Clostridioides difficile]|nr:phage tail tape measure protein [Clostridioides difficile]HBF9356742.1 phage tail tape measure protein [Clostridioides difficile]
QEFVKKVDDLTKAIVDALKEKYKQEYEAQQASIKKELDALDKWKEESIDRINSVYDAKIKAIDNELEAFEKAEKEKDRLEQDKEELNKIEEIKTAIKFEHDDTNKEQLQKELEKVLAERKKRIEQQEIEDKKEALKKRKEELEEKKKDEIENINQIYESEKEYYNKRLEDAKKFYDERIKESKLQAEAEKLIMDKNQKEIVALLNSYSDAYKNAGQTLGEKLLEGFKPAINEIKNLIDSITREINNAR